MKNAIRVSVQKPCTEKFDNFSSTKNGGYCNKCQKEVIDFTRMSDTELIKLVSENNNTMCGRFNTSQLKNYEFKIAPMNTNNLFSKSVGIMSFSLLALCMPQQNIAQELASTISISQTESNATSAKQQSLITHQEQATISGIVRDEENLPLPGVNVVLKGTEIGVITDLEGRFEFVKTLKIDDTLVFSYIGYEKIEYKITEDNISTTAITITFDAYDIELMGAVELGGTYKTKRNVFQKFVALFK